ncbi:MAG: hypothetical protein ACR2LV_09855 [Solirubrobacteraceae bacterium]
MIPFVVVLLIGAVTLGVWLWLLGRYYPGRRARGKAPDSIEDVEMRVTQDDEDERHRREQPSAQRELDELLQATNARRRARGLPERTRAQAQREFGPDPASGS